MSPEGEETEEKVLEETAAKDKDVEVMELMTHGGPIHAVTVRMGEDTFISASTADVSMNIGDFLDKVAHHLIVIEAVRRGTPPNEAAKLAAEALDMEVLGN